MTKNQIVNYKNASYTLLLLLIIFIAMTFKQHGISNDEFVQHTYGQLLLKWYTSGFKDQTAFHYVNLYLYGGFFDLIAAGLEKVTSLWVWDLRHLLTAIFGFFGFIAVYKISVHIGGQRAGFFALVLLVLTAPWSGAMFTHTKDIPFATCMAWALYYTVVATRTLPKIPRSVSVKLGIALGCAVGLRIGAVFAVIYLLLTLMVVCLLERTDNQSKFKFLKEAIKALIPAAVVAFILMAIFWPWGVMSPDHPFEAIKTFSHFAFNMKTIDDRVVYSIGEVPRTYLLDYLSVKLPEVFLLGLASFLVLFGFYRKLWWNQLAQDQHNAVFAVFIAVLFPIVFVLATEPALYNGVRHFTFIIPPLAVLSALGIHFALYVLSKSVKWTVTLWSVCVLMSVYTFTYLYTLHPYEYVYYNEIAGKRRLLKNEWEGDYWSSSLREAAKDLMSLPLAKRDKPYLVAVCAEDLQGSAYLDSRFKVTKDWVGADFYMSSTNMHCDQVLQGTKIVEVKRRGLVLAVVKDRRMLEGTARYPTPAPN